MARLKCFAPEFFTKTAGFAVLEILIALAIISAVFSAALLFDAGEWRADLFYAERDLAINVLQRARAMALANISQQTQGVRLGIDNICPGSNNDCYIIFEGVFDKNSNRNIFVPYIAKNIGRGQMEPVVFSQLDASIESVPSPWIFVDGVRQSKIIFNSEGMISLE